MSYSEQETEHFDIWNIFLCHRHTHYRSYKLVKNGPVFCPLCNVTHYVKSNNRQFLAVIFSLSAVFCEVRQYCTNDHWNCIHYACFVTIY